MRKIAGFAALASIMLGCAIDLSVMNRVLEPILKPKTSVAAGSSAQAVGEA
ncbi:MAG: hypothetical protein SNJ56_03455 [Termitinemataceae bacterium]